MGRLDGKVAIVTGAAHGMGLAAVKLFTEEGAKVVALDKNAATLKANVEALENPDILVELFDVTDEEGWHSIVDKALKAFGRIDVLINNAGMQLGPESVVDTTREDWDAIIANDLTAVWLGMKAVIPVMLKGGGGSIVNTSSIAAIAGGLATGGSAPYAAAKGGVRALTKQAANDYGKDGIRVNSVHPGTTNAAIGSNIDEGGIADMWSEEEIAAYMQALAANTPLSMTMADPIDQAYAYLYLASDESRFVTGIELVVDGGFVSH